MTRVQNSKNRLQLSHHHPVGHVNPLFDTTSGCGPYLGVTAQKLIFSSLFKYMILFIYFISGCAASSLLHRLPLAAESRGYSPLQCSGFSLQWGCSCCRARALGHTGFSSCGSQALEHRLSSCHAQAYLLHRMWDLPKPVLKPVSPALEGGFFITEPPEEPSTHF